MPLVSTMLSTSPDLTVRHVRCRAEHHGASDVERADADTLVLPLRGVFVKHLDGGREVVGEPSTALLFARGRPHRVSHPGPLSDECLVLRFAPETTGEILADVAGVERLDDRRLRPRAGVGFRVAALRDLLHRRLQRGLADEMEAYETGLELLAAAVRGAVNDDRRPAAPRRRHRRAADRVAALQAMLHAAPAEPTSLGELAARLGATPGHLSRTFKHHIGLPIHEYRTRLRLMFALRDLLDTDHDITRIALEHGFSSHSHFTYAFRRRARITPREAREMSQASTRARLREVRKALFDWTRPAW